MPAASTTTDTPVEAVQEPTPEVQDTPVEATPDAPKVEKFEDVYLVFHSDHGVNPDGDLEPLVEIGYVSEIGDGKRESIKPANELPKGFPKARIIPDTRIVHVGDRLTAAALITLGDASGTPLFEQIDPPKKADIDKHVALTRDAVEKAGTFNEEN